MVPSWLLAASFLLPQGSADPLAQANAAVAAAEAAHGKDSVEVGEGLPGLWGAFVLESAH